MVVWKGIEKEPDSGLRSAAGFCQSTLILSMLRLSVYSYSGCCAPYISLLITIFERARNTTPAVLLC